MAFYLILPQYIFIASDFMFTKRKKEKKIVPDSQHGNIKVCSENEFNINGYLMEFTLVFSLGISVFIANTLTMRTVPSCTHSSEKLFSEQKHCY